MTGCGTSPYNAPIVSKEFLFLDGSNGSGIARKTRGVPVFLMTPNRADTAFLDKAMGDGARGVIVRPLTEENVEEALKKVFEE